MTTSAQNLTSRNERVINTQTLGALPSIEYGLIRAHVFASLVTLVISVLFGILVATKFTFPEFLGGHGWLTWGRLRYNHTQGIFFGWLGNAFLAFFYYAVPRLANRPVLSRKLGWFLFWIWNFAVVLPGWVLVAAGFSQPLEWAEFPLVVAAFVVLAFILMAFEFVLPFLKARLSDLYVSGWYIIGGIVFTMLAYPVGNLVPWLVPGARGAAFSGLWIHDAVGLYVTPFAVAIAYYVIPATTRRPISSHFLSMVGFWLLFFVYPLNGTHHYVYSAIPMAAQKGAIVASAYLGMDVILVVTNLLLSLRGSSGTVSKDVPLRFVWFGVLSSGEFAGFGTGVDAGQSLHSFYGLGYRPLAPCNDRFCKFHRARRHRPFVATHPRNTLQRAHDELVVLASCSGPDADGHRSYDCGPRRGSVLAVERAMDRFCPCGRKLLASAYALGSPYSRGLGSFLDFSGYGAKVARGHDV